MRTVTLKATQPPDYRIDASSLSLKQFAGLEAPQIESFLVGDSGLRIGDIANVEVSESEIETLRLEGDFANFDAIGSHHERGLIVIEGNVGDLLGGARGGHRKGMTGGRIEVSGNAGNQVGYRMRRGEIFIAGSVGNFLAAHVLAGTIVVAGSTGSNVAYGMKRGSIILAQMPELTSPRFSLPVKAEPNWLSLMRCPSDAKVRDLLVDLTLNGGPEVVSRRGDAAVNGRGELIGRR